MNSKEFSQRQDIRIQESIELNNIIKKFKSDNKQRFYKPNSKKAKVRKTFIESKEKDPNGYERLIGKSNLLSTNFLTRGLRASKAVCRIRVPTGESGWHGTGFLVGPRLLLTNHHVISTIGEAQQAEAEFDYEHDVFGILKDPIKFNLAAGEIFYTNKDLDITLVSLARYSDKGVNINRFGYLPLLPLAGKGIQGEWVTIIQHPGGGPKQLTIRKSQIMELEGEEFYNLTNRFIHYSTDTEPGSSGAPVLNDQWQVVAVHHKAIPQSYEDLKNKGDQNIKWLANEGVRISAIFELLQKNRFSDVHASRALEQLSKGIGIRPLQNWSPQNSSSIEYERERKPYKKEHWEGVSLGYNPDFLNVNLPIKEFLGEKINEAATLKDDNTCVELKYMHFSSVIHKSRKFPIMTVVNILGSELKHPGGRSDSWRRDIRMEEEYQPGDNFYLRTIGNDKVAFSRGIW